MVRCNANDLTSPGCCAQVVPPQMAQEIACVAIIFYLHFTYFAQSVIFLTFFTVASLLKAKVALAFGFPGEKRSTFFSAFPLFTTEDGLDLAASEYDSSARSTKPCFSH